jgi:hypothetical protein
MSVGLSRPSGCDLYIGKSITQTGGGVAIIAQDGMLAVPFESASAM